MTQPAKSRCQPPEVCELVVDQPQPSIGWPSSGPIRAEAVVRHIEAGSELGLKFTAVTRIKTGRISLPCIQGFGTPLGPVAKSNCTVRF